MAAAEAAAPPPPGEGGKRPEGDEWCDSGLGSLGDGQLAPLPPSPGPAAGALHLAVIHEHEAFLDSILQHTEGTAYLDLQNDLGQTALHLAVILGFLAFVCKRRGAGPGVQERGGHTALHLACREGQPACARHLLGPPRTPPAPETGLAQGHGGGGIPVTPPCPPPPGYTPLHVAILRKDLELVQLLLRAGADLNKAEPSCGRTPLHLAVEAQSPELAELLLRAGADPAARGYGGRTPLYSARHRPDPRLPQLLRAFGAPDPPGDSEDSEEEEEEDEEDDDDGGGDSSGVSGPPPLPLPETVSVPPQKSCLSPPTGGHPVLPPPPPQKNVALSPPGGTPKFWQEGLSVVLCVSPPQEEYDDIVINSGRCAD
uniref:NFKB inhibitor beta n=1 Tax=Anas platyrhynchos TaxID=8839 RepID=A0A8B9TKR0_ANAPL